MCVQSSVQSPDCVRTSASITKTVRSQAFIKPAQVHSNQTASERTPDIIAVHSHTERGLPNRLRRAGRAQINERCVACLHTAIIFSPLRFLCNAHIYIYFRFEFRSSVSARAVANSTANYIYLRFGSVSHFRFVLNACHGPFRIRVQLKAPPVELGHDTRALWPLRVGVRFFCFAVTEPAAAMGNGSLLLRAPLVRRQSILVTFCACARDCRQRTAAHS